MIYTGKGVFSLTEFTTRSHKPVISPFHTWTVFRNLVTEVYSSLRNAAEFIVFKGFIDMGISGIGLFERFYGKCGLKNFRVLGKNYLFNYLFIYLIDRKVHFNDFFSHLYHWLTTDQKTRP